MARHKAVDRLRREAVRGAKEAASVRLSPVLPVIYLLFTEGHMANRAVAVAMAEGPAAGLVILDVLAGG